MAFIADKQTLEDLNVLGRYKSNSLYSLFNQTQTNGGGQLLDHMFNHPLTEETGINQRSDLFRFFRDMNTQFPVDAEDFAQMENYLLSGGGYNRISNSLLVLRRNCLKAMGLRQEYELFHTGYRATIRVLKQLVLFFDQLSKQHLPVLLKEELMVMQQLFGQSKMSWLMEAKPEESTALWKLMEVDHLLRNVLQDNMKRLLKLVYLIDVGIAVAAVARERDLIFATALPAAARVIAIEDCRHPALEKAIGNDLTLDENNNLLFLTGANMAGKSTFMKSFGVAVYLAHMGFPVAARSMRFSVKQGIWSSINVPDNLDMGLSHFYAEVLRVKKVATEVASKKDLLVIFDELFKGTNVKDAYDATLAVAESLIPYRNCCFIISTHIMEVGTALQEKCSNLRFGFMPTVMDGVVPRYTYKMQEGISADRHGMMIIENEKILDIIG